MATDEDIYGTPWTEVADAGGTPWTEAAGDGINWAKVKDALKTLGSNDRQQQGNQSTLQAQAGGSQSGIGRPAAPVSFDRLLAALQARRDAYMNSAMNPQTAKPIAGVQPHGLLGF